MDSNTFHFRFFPYSLVHYTRYWTNNGLKDFLNEHGVDFEDIDVASDQKAATYIIEKSGQMAVPIIEINDEIIVGFDRDAIIKALKIKD